MWFHSVLCAMKSYLQRMAMFTNPELERMLREPYLNSKQQITLIRRYKLAKNKDKKLQLRDEIFNNNVRFIRKCVYKKVSTHPDEIEDAFNAAVISFFEGLDKFKPNKGFKFQTYIKYWIDRALYDQYISRNIVTIQTGEFFKNDKSEVYLAKNASLNYLDKPVLTDNGDEMNHMNVIDKYLLKDDVDGEDQIIDDMNIVNMAMSKVLREHEALLIRLNYLCDPPLTIAEIAKVVSVSQARVGQILRSSLSKIRRYIKSGGEMKRRRWSYSADMSSKTPQSFYVTPSTIPSYTEKQIQKIHRKIIESRITFKNKGKKM